MAKATKWSVGTFTTGGFCAYRLHELEEAKLEAQGMADDNQESAFVWGCDDDYNLIGDAEYVFEPKSN